MVGIGYKSRALVGSSSFDAAPVTGSLLFYAPVSSSWVLFGGCDSTWLAVFRSFFRRVSVDGVMATDSDATAGAGLA